MLFHYIISVSTPEENATHYETLPNWVNAKKKSIK